MTQYGEYIVYFRDGSAEEVPGTGHYDARERARRLFRRTPTGSRQTRAKARPHLLDLLPLPVESEVPA